jgi:WbqC-like protein family
LHKIAATLRLDTRIVRDTMYPAQGAKSERLLGIIRAAGADRYLSGPSAKAYLDEAMFIRAGIAVEWMDYSGQPAYPQLYGPFDPSLSIIDLLFSVGDGAAAYLSHVARPDPLKTEE